MRSTDQIRQGEAGRIARWFRETEIGWVMFDAAGRAWPIEPHERELWEARALRDLDAHLAWQRRAPVLLVLFCLGMTIAWAACVAVLGDAAPGLRRVPAWLPLVPACAWIGSAGWRFRLAQRRQRRAIVARLAARSPIAAELATPHRRHNLFARLRDGLSLAAFGVIGLAVLRGDATPPPHVYVMAGGLTGAAWLLHLAALRVDATHRRRRALG